MIHRLQPDTPEERQRWHESGLEKPGVIEFVRNTLTTLRESPE